MRRNTIDNEEDKEETAPKKKIDLIQIKIHNFTIRVDQLKKQLRERERKEKKAKLERLNEVNQLQKENWDFSYSKIKDITNQFFRNNEKKNEQMKLKLHKEKINIDMVNRNIEINRKVHHLKKVSLRNQKVQSKLGIKESNTIELLKQNLTRAKNKIKSLSAPQTKRNRKKGYNKSFIEEHKSKLQGCKVLRMNKAFSAKKIKDNSSSIILKSSSTSRVNYSPVKNYLNSSSNIKEPVISSSYRTISNKVKNLPLYTTKIDDIIKEYDNIKDSMENERRKYIKNHILGMEQIDEIIKTRTEMKIMKLKQKYLSTRFPEAGLGKSGMSLSEMKGKISKELDKIDRKFYLTKEKEFDFTKDDFFDLSIKY